MHNESVSTDAPIHLDVVAEATAAAKAGQLGRSLALLNEALRNRSRDGELLYARALTLLDWGRLNDALAGLRAALAAGFSSFGLFVNLCQVCHASGLADEAEQHALRAVALDDRQAAGHLCLAVIRQAAKRYPEAIELYERGYALAPERMDCLWEIVSCLLTQNDTAAAEIVARRAISVSGENHAKSWTVLASVLAMRDRWDEAIGAFERAEAIEARTASKPEAFVMHGLRLLNAGRLNAAIDLYARYLPTSADPGAHAHYGLVLLTSGHLRDGWPFYEFRWTFDRLQAIRPRLGRPEWHGQELKGKRLLLWAEQGVGDIVQFVRLARAFNEKGAIVVLHVPDRLREFAKCFRGVDRVVSEPGEFAGAFDFHLSLMSASGALGIDLDSIPHDVPYITIDPDRKRRWRERLASPASLRVGLAWAGNPNHEHDHLRSIPLGRLAPLLAVEGVRFFSLQKELRSEDAGTLAPGTGMVDLAPELGDFRDTAAAIDALDLVIAVDTAVIHIAGALAKPAWVMLQTPPDFRWLIEGDSSPWYPTVRLFRQQRVGEWEDVVDNVREALAKAARAWNADNESLACLGPVAAQDRCVATRRQLSISPMCGITDTRYGIVQYIRGEEARAHSLEFYGEWLQPEVDVAATVLKSGGVVIEAGSGIGAHTLALAKLVGEAGCVFAYEPDPTRAQVLFQNLQANQLRHQVIIMERWLVGSTATPGVASVDLVAEREQANACDTVDDLALNRLDLLKINVTGAADRILDGSRDTLWRLRPVLLVTCGQEQFPNLAEKLASFGYRCWRIPTPYFSATNHAGRDDDIFGGRSALALAGVPEELNPMPLLDGYGELFTPGTGINHGKLEIARARPQRSDSKIAGVARSIESFPPSEKRRSEQLEALVKSGLSSLQRGDATTAEATFRDALRGGDDSAPAWNGLGVALALQDRHGEARNALEHAGQLERAGGESCDSFVNLANSFASEGRLEDALAVYRRELPSRPSPQGHHNYALGLLSAGQLIEGWRHYEFRWLVEPLAALRPRYPQPQWGGQDLRGKSILLHCEQGLGDTIQFVRYAPRLKELGARVMLLVQPQLAELARGFAGIDAVVPETMRISFDYYVPLLSLPRIFGTDLSSIPADVPYVTVQTHRQAEWERRLTGEGRPKVGVVWAGSRTHPRDRSRSLPLRDLEEVLGVAGIGFYSLQKPVEGAPVNWMTVVCDLVDLGPHLDDFADTAAAIGQMDLVLCVDTSVAHLAGALGKPLWLMVPRVADWRWLEERNDSPWYPTIRLFRQATPNDWGDVINRVKAALNQWVRGERSTKTAAAKGIERGTFSSLPWIDPAQLKAGHREGFWALGQTRVGLLQYLPDEPIVGDAIGWYGEYLQSQLDLLATLVHRGATVIELGSGIGANAVFLGRMLGERGHLFLHEPRPVARRVMRQNLAANDVKNVTILEQWETIDKLQLRRLDCLKIASGIDALQALVGGRETLWRLRPLLFVAAADENALERLTDETRAFGYRCWRMETPLFNEKNFNRREKDIFDGRSELALLAIPEERDIDRVFDGCSEIS